MKVKTKALCAALSVIVTFASVACSGKPEAEESSGAKNDNSASESTFDYADAVLGKDFTDITADLKITTNRTDLIEDAPDSRDFQDYIREFNEMYPNVTITYEGITSYDDDMTTRLTSNDWGDICCIPSTVAKSELSTYFEPIGELSQLGNNYRFVEKAAYSGTVYGIPSTGNVQGIVYNKRVFSEAGVETIPATTAEFLEALRKISENTDAIPLYTNYAAGWALTAWDNYIGSCATGNSAFKNQILPHADAPFSDRGDGTGPYAVYKMLYDAVDLKLTEDDPTTTDWESSKSRINSGEIAAMVLGSWAVPQMQEAGNSPEDIGYMPFPITVNGKRYTSASADYCYGVNKNISDDEKTAAMLYIKYLTEKSGYAFDNGGVPIVKGESYPEVLESFSGVEMITDDPALEGEEDLFNIVSNDSEMSLDADPTHIARVIEAASTGSEDFEDIIADWNERWKDAQDRNGIEIY